MFGQRKRSGQAAIEFLTTYGWAILMILVMIGALSAFGIMNPDFLVPERCNLPPDFNCVEYAAWRGENSDGQFDIVLSNSLGRTLEVFDITRFESGSTDDSEDGNCEIVSDHDNDLYLAGERVHFSCDDLDSDGWNQVGGKQSFDLQVEYRAQGFNLTQSLSIGVVTAVQEGDGPVHD